MVTYPDAAALVASHLRTELPANGFTGRVVSVIPDQRVDVTLVRRVGGTTRNEVTDAALLTVEAWAADEGAAMDRLQKARAILHDLPGTVLDDTPVYRVVEVAGPAALPDPLSTQPRATCTVEVWLRGA